MIDLKQLMEERSALPPALADVRYPQIRHRITMRNRRRVALLATATAVILAIVGGYAALPNRQAPPGPITPSPTRTSQGFPPFEFGRKLMHSETAPLSGKQVTLSWMPTTPTFHFSDLCSGIPANMVIRGSIFVNGNRYNEFRCTGRNSSQPARIEDWTRSGWIRAGEPITFTYIVEGAETLENMPTPMPLPSDGTISVAIYVPVPFEEYQLPPRPAQLPALADWTGCNPEHFVASDPRNPLQAMSVTTEWVNTLFLRWDTQTPGLLHVAVDGVEVATLGWWDYGGLNWSRYWHTTDESEWAGPPGWRLPAQGQRVTITFTPEHFTGRWQASLDHLLPTQDAARCP